MKKKEKLLIAGVVLLAGFAGLLKIGVPYLKQYCDYYMVGRLKEETLDELELENYKKLMIVAHPDDETIWGGVHLLEDDYLVVCITNGKNEIRSNEFFQALSHSGDKGLILDYPDKTYGERDDWSHVYDKIERDLSLLLDYQAWELVVTHNPQGEYGHAHHIMTNEMVTNLCKEKKYRELFYFGEYYKKKELEKLEDLPESQREDLVKKKTEEMIPEYHSQSKVTDGLSHMFPYENWYHAEIDS